MIKLQQHAIKNFEPLLSKFAVLLCVGLWLDCEECFQKCNSLDQECSICGLYPTCGLL